MYWINLTKERWIETRAVVILLISSPFLVNVSLEQGVGGERKPMKVCWCQWDFGDQGSLGPLTLPFIPRDLISAYLVNGHDLKKRRQEKEWLASGPQL